MRIFVPTEFDPSERRVPVVPSTVGRLVKLGAQIEVETGLGRSINFSDADYQAAGASVLKDRQAGLGSAEMILRLHGPPLAEIGTLKRDCLHVSHLDPFNKPDLVQALAAAGVNAICMEMIPRTTIAQKMDALSSQASLGGLCRGDARRRSARPRFSHDDDARGHDPAGEDFHHRRGRRGPAGHRHRQAPRCGGRGVRHAARRRGTGEIARCEIRQSGPR